MTQIELEYPHCYDLVSQFKELIEDLREQVHPFRGVGYIENFYHYLKSYYEQVASPETLSSIERRPIPQIDLIYDDFEHMKDSLDEMWVRYTHDPVYLCNHTMEVLSSFYKKLSVS